MKNVVAISLPESLLKKLSREAKTERTTRSEIVRKALQDHFFVHDFTKLRRQASQELTRKGLKLTEEQIFREVS